MYITRMSFFIPPAVSNARSDAQYTVLEHIKIFPAAEPCHSIWPTNMKRQSTNAVSYKASPIQRKCWQTCPKSYSSFLILTDMYQVSTFLFALLLRRFINFLLVYGFVSFDGFSCSHFSTSSCVFVHALYRDDGHLIKPFPSSIRESAKSIGFDSSEMLLLVVAMTTLMAYGALPVLDASQ